MLPDWCDCSQVCRAIDPAPGATVRRNSEVKRRFPAAQTVDSLAVKEQAAVY